MNTYEEAFDERFPMQRTFIVRADEGELDGPLHASNILGLPSLGEGCLPRVLDGKCSWIPAKCVSKVCYATGPCEWKVEVKYQLWDEVAA